MNSIETLPQRAARFFREGNFVVLDTETSGKDPYDKRIEIVEITILDVDGMPLINTLIKPVYPVPDEAIYIHGITNEMLQAEHIPTFEAVFPAIAQAIQGKCVIVYNSDFDIALLENVTQRHGLALPDFFEFCLMRSYADYWKAPGKYGSYAWQSLTRACQQQSVVVEDAHRAMGDTLATYRLLQKLASMEGEA